MNYIKMNSWRHFVLNIHRGLKLLVWYSKCIAKQCRTSKMTLNLQNDYKKITSKRFDSNRGVKRSNCHKTAITNVKKHRKSNSSYQNFQRICPNRIPKKINVPLKFIFKVRSIVLSGCCLLD